ncbi:MAG: competence/damage-inducible protein A [Paludibacteraceae bacterium]|nr:competence/damage-inducible protein A [Paludibacteraceae bacterium]
MTAHIINIGDELLIGQVVNTNASWMAEELNKRNIKVTNISVISDGGDDIRTQLERSLSEADVVLITGGLGPTKDDITKSVLCEFFGDTLVRHQQTYDNVKKFFERRGLPFTAINQAQALVPSKCKVLVNEVGTAPCMVFTMPQVETQYIASLQTEAKPFEKIVISMPGVPFEMKWLMQNSVLPLLQERLGGEAIVHKTILTFGIGESFLADKIADWEDALSAHIKLAYLPEAGKVRLRLSAYGVDHTELEREVAEQIVKLNAIISDNIYGYDDETISMAIGKLLKQQGAMVATAESCSGGLVARRITEAAGASDYFKGGVVAYSNEIKMKALGVNPDTLERYGAVSEQTAKEMALGCLNMMDADYAIATTGIAGPTGATETKPLGLVYIAIASHNEVVCNRYVFTTTREQHQERTANQALFDLYKLVQSRKS